ncbi:hypothetical protein PoB_000029000 [Plakobranchus ocellatus]|uniref:Uncharacterized protein n=1 Tax=Plakobranchus ocellatus TaxID=259542 RepID=A0AAV3XS26_9GAST|nr:hypothetical protein PoB_000029000 [Plakobranchus ocellatus]
MYRCILSSKSALQTSNSDHDVLPANFERGEHHSSQCYGEIPAAKLAAWRASKNGLMRVRSGRSFMEPLLGRLPPCRNLVYQQLNTKTPLPDKTKYRRQNLFVARIRGSPVSLLKR